MTAEKELKEQTDQPLSLVIGRQIRELRQAAGLRQDEVARFAREIGWNWTAATVAAIETGRRELSLAEFLTLPFIGGQFGDHAPRSLGEFIGSDAALAADDPAALAAVLLSPDILIGRVNLRALVQGAKVRGAEFHRDHDGKLRHLPPAADEISRTALFSRRANRRKISARLETQFDAERKAARRLGVTTEAIVNAARRLWGRTLTKERDTRVKDSKGTDSARSLQALRGHVTRELLDELQQGLKNKRRRRS